MPPTFANGKICYLQIPAEDIARSAGFYQRVFGWNIRQNNHGHTAFDDTVGGVSGAWVTGRPPASTPGILVYIMVDSVAVSIEAITAAGGTIVQPIGGDPGEITARFSDPAGNVVGLYEHNSKT
jgi:predicted enzyme related to lactoylglutathione lyase